MKEWNEITIDVHSVNWQGKPIIIHNVPAQSHTKITRVKVNPDDVVRAEFTEIAKELKINDRDIMLFLLLYAKPGAFQRGYLCQKYKINKMLFYQWKELEKKGFGNCIPRDEFEADSRGPVPKNLWDDLKRLREEGLLKVEGKKNEKKTVTIELTDKGISLAQKLWNCIPDLYSAATTCVKYKLFSMSPEQIKEMVHSDYPQYKKTYKVPDIEEILKI